MGLLLDIVPNHMAASVDNPWWENVLRQGAKSPYASFFDVDWNRKLLLPVLAAPYGEVLEAGQLQVRAGGERTLESSLQ
jgi:(1->4)-alpha-D-glucan 1-alpha-D-glucosylmutase